MLLSLGRGLESHRLSTIALPPAVLAPLAICVQHEAKRQTTKDRLEPYDTGNPHADQDGDGVVDEANSYGEEKRCNVNDQSSQVKADELIIEAVSANPIALLPTENSADAGRPEEGQSKVGLRHEVAGHELHQRGGDEGDEGQEGKDESELLHGILQCGIVTA